MKKGQSPNKWTTEEFEAAMQMRADGYSYAAIARVLGRDRSGVRKKLDMRAKAAHIKKCAAYYRNNIDKVKEIRRQHYECNKKEKKEATRKWRIANPEKRKAQHIRRRAKEKSVYTLQNVSSTIITKILASNQGLCCWCNSSPATTIDHFLPISYGGTHCPSNLLPACNQCNGRKQASDPYVWFKNQPFFSNKSWQNILKLTGKQNCKKYKVHYGQIGFA